LMQVGFSPELTQAAYRVGDSVTNIITPLNPYMVIILAQVQKYSRGSGMGTLIAMMLPYALCFALVWTLLLTAWMLLDIPLGPGAPLHFDLSSL
jgi:aminobenzoyl-glutamate transport protein